MLEQGDEAIRISRRQEAAAAGIYHLITRGIIIAMITVVHKLDTAAVEASGTNRKKATTITFSLSEEEFQNIYKNGA